MELGTIPMPLDLCNCVSSCWNELRRLGHTVRNVESKTTEELRPDYAH